MISLPEVADNVRVLRQRIRNACLRAGRDPASVQLIAITKNHPPEVVRHAVEAGLLDLGENRVQELLAKIQTVQDPVRWHLVGHLQTNKVNKVVGRVRLIHSVDTLHLAQAIDRASGAKGMVTDILIQVHTSGKETQFGCRPEEALPLVREIAPLANVRICGLMTIGTFSEIPEEVRPCFQRLRRIFEEIRKAEIPRAKMEELSMGMTGDFETAIEEGATMIRIGKALFGERRIA